MVPIPHVFALARTRALARTSMAAALVLLGLSLPAARSSTAAPPSRQATLTLPRAKLGRAAVPVIVMMNQWSPTIYVHMMKTLHSYHANNVHVFHLIPAVAATVHGSELPDLFTQPGVRTIVLDRQHALPAIPDAENLRAANAGPSVSPGRGPVIDVPQTAEPQSLALTRADVAQARGYTGAGVRVAVIDSGLDINQPDLRGVAATDARGVPLRVDFTGTGLQDTVGHGTATASMIAAQGRMLYTGDNRTLLQVYPAPTGRIPIERAHFRVRGMAPGVRLLSAKIFDTRVPNGGGFDSWIVRAIEWAVDHHADVISESLGGLSVPSTGVDPVAEADEAAIRAGVTVVAADGNEGPGQTTISSPAAAPGVIAVGASTEFRLFGQTGFLAPFGQTTADNVASFTSRGPTSDGRPRPDLAAPGAFAWALFPQQRSEDGPNHAPFDVGTFGGTSQATPVTAGAAALVIGAFRQAHHGVTPAPSLVRSILMSAAHDLGYPASDQGAGRVDAWKAVQTATHTGPSFLIAPNSLAIGGPVAAPFTVPFTITNTSPTRESYSVDASQSPETSVREWAGTVEGSALQAFHVTVTPGLERIVGAVYWNSADRFAVQGSSQEVALRVALYDPQGRFVNYSFGVGSGFAAAQAAHPLPGTWSVVVSENGRRDSFGVPHDTPVRFHASLSTYRSIPYGTLSPRTVTLAPGQAVRVTLRGVRPLDAGTHVVTVHVTGDHTAALPIALTPYIALRGGSGRFRGVFAGASNAYFSLANENKVYSLNVLPGTRTLQVGLTWPDAGYGVVLLLLDPSGQIVDSQFNGIASGGADAPFDLSARDLAATWSTPAAGRWQIVVSDAVFAGQQLTEPFAGRVTLDETPVTPRGIARTVLPGGSFAITLGVRNDNGPDVAEGYIGYATTDTYSDVPLGQVHGSFGSTSITGSSVFTYTTGFVPPGTRLVVSSIAALRPAVPLDLSLADPSGFARAEGQPGALSTGRATLQATVAAVSGDELPSGAWSGTVTLRRPGDAGARPILVGASYANALTPLAWLSFDHGLQNGRLTGGQPLILLPRQQGTLHASATVPLSTGPGTYHAHLFVDTVRGDRVAMIPLTITVQAHTGTEPAAGQP